MKAFLAPVAFAAAILLAPPILLAPVTAQADIVHVGIKNYKFTPDTITVSAGTTVQWINLDSIPHTVTEKTKAWRSAALDTNDTYNRTFDQPGTYDYFCSLHPMMVAKVIVTPATGAAAAKPKK